MSAAVMSCAIATGTRYRPGRFRAGSSLNVQQPGLSRENDVTFRTPCALALFAMPVIAIAAPAPATGDLAAVQHHLQSVESMTASFTQTDRAGKVLTGVLTLKKPGKIRFQY